MRAGSITKGGQVDSIPLRGGVEVPPALLQDSIVHIARVPPAGWPTHPCLRPSNKITP